MRIKGLDAARTLAIVLAMLSHVNVETHALRTLPEPVAQAFKFMFQAATPIFILLFGTMLEVVYQPRWAAGARREVAARLLSRALQCWALYAVTIFALFLTHDGYSALFSISTILFMGNSPYTEILKFYAAVLALAPLVLLVRERVGLASLALMALAYHIAWPVLDALPDVRQDLGAPIHLGRLFKFVTGFGDLSLAGPSVLHGLTLLVAGQALGRFLMASLARQQQSGKSSSEVTPAPQVPALLVSAVAVIVAGALALPDGTFEGLVGMELRMQSHALYFAAGVMTATVITVALVWLVDIRKVGSGPFWHRLTFFGRTSMFTFAWGNILLYVVDLDPQTASAAWTQTALLFAAICGMSFAFDLAVRRSPAVRDSLRLLIAPADHLANSFLTRTGASGAAVRG